MTTLTDTLRVWASAPDPIDLVVVPVDERDPAALVLGVPALRLVDDAADDRGSIIDDAGHQPLVGAHRSRRSLAAFLLGRGQDVGRLARGRRGVVDGADLGDARAVAKAIPYPGQRSSGQPRSS